MPSFSSKSTLPPGPKGQLPGSIVLQMKRDMPGFFTKLARDYGDIVYFKAGLGMNFCLLNHPDYIRDVLVTKNQNFVKGPAYEMFKFFLGEGLVTSEGELWLRQRRLAQPAFHRQRIQAYGTIITDYTAQMRERWKQLPTGATLDINHEMLGLTLPIAVKTLCNTDVEGEVHEFGEAMYQMMLFLERAMWPWCAFLNKLPLPSTRRFNQARDRLNTTIYRIIQEHRAKGVDQGDLLSMLLLAQDEEGDGGSMTDQQLRDEVMTIVSAGHETLTNSLTFIWYLLSQHPEIETKLHAEIDMVLEGRLPTTDDLPQLKYTEMVFAEAMRLYPPAWGINRRAVNDVELETYHLPVGTIVLISQWVTHRDARFFPDPQRFDPERWTPEAKAARPKFSYFPFGGGPRLCIGEAFAWMEAVLIIATLAQQWRMRLIPDYQLELEPLLTLRPKGGMPMRLERR